MERDRFFKWNAVVISQKMKDYDKIVISNLKNIGVRLIVKECNIECRFNQQFMSVSHMKD